MGRNHARVLAGLDGVDLVGVVEPANDPQGNAQGGPVVATVQELIELGIDYAVVACPTGLHEEVGLALAEAGVGALIEKPLAHSVEAAQRLVDAFESRGLVAGVGHIERYNPALQSLRSRLQAGDLGEIYQVVTRRQGPFPARIADVGVVKDLATHDIDLTSWVTGREYVSVSAHTSRKSGREHEDMVVVVGELDGGTMVNHLVNWLSPLKERSTVVTGTKRCFIAAIFCDGRRCGLLCPTVVRCLPDTASNWFEHRRLTCRLNGRFLKPRMLAPFRRGSAEPGFFSNVPDWLFTAGGSGCVPGRPSNSKIGARR